MKRSSHKIKKVPLLLQILDADKEQLIRELLPQPMRVQIAGLPRTVLISISE